MNKELFFKKYCAGCGSQRCDGSEEWMEGCALYQEHVLGDCPKSMEDIIEENQILEKYGTDKIIHLNGCGGES